MNDEELEKRLRDWLPAEVPWALDVRLHAARPVPARRGYRFWVATGTLTGAALAAVWMLSLAGSPSPAARRAAPAVRSTAANLSSPDTGSHVAFGENLTVNIATGVQRESLLAARRLDRDDPVSGPIDPFLSGRGFSLKADFQF